jgi:hypothetical protein
MTTITLANGRMVEVHPAADLPMMPEAKLRELGEDIRKHGLWLPIAFYVEAWHINALRDGSGAINQSLEMDRKKAAGALPLIDGSNRLMAMNLVGILDEQRLADLFKKAKLYWRDDGTPEDIVYSLGVPRRHLDAEMQRERIAARVRSNPEKSNRQIAEMTDTSHPTVAKVRAKLEASGDVEAASTRIDTRGRHQPTKKEPSLFSRVKTGDAETVSTRSRLREPPPPPDTGISAPRPSPAHVSAAADQFARLLRGAAGTTVSEMPMPDRISIAHDILDGLGVAGDDLFPSRPAPAPVDASTPPAEVIAALITEMQRTLLTFALLRRHSVNGSSMFNMVGKQEVLATPFPFASKQVKDLGEWFVDLAKPVRKIERERKAGEPKPTKSEPPEITAQRDALRRCLDSGQTQVHVARATDIAASQLNAFLAARVRLGPASAARLSAYLAEHAARA